MTEEEFRADLLASSASRAETQSLGAREAFMSEILDRLRESGELPDAEPCAESLAGQRGRKLEIDAFSFDEADDSLHLFIGILSGSSEMPAVMTLTEAREQGFNRLLGVYEQARSGWLKSNIEESRPLWSLAQRIEAESKRTAIRLHVLTDRCLSERVREISPEATDGAIPVSFQIWDVGRLKRIYEGRTARGELVVEFGMLSEGGLPVLHAAVGDTDYDGFLGVIPAWALADIYIRYGSRLLEGNVRTFLGRRGNVNKGIAITLSKEPARFFAYNNGIAATACAVTMARGRNGAMILTDATDLQIVNGAQTTASLAAARRDGKLPLEHVFVPMKLSVVPSELASEMIPRISRYANSQNAVRASDFFANHEFHRRVEEISRRVLAPAVGGSQVQTHWYYERARGQHLNDQAGMTTARKEQYLRLNPRSQVVTKTDLAKVENCFQLLPDVACKGAEKSFTEFAERITKEWLEENRRAIYSDDWFRGAVGRVILFRTTEKIVSEASWYEGGYRAQIVCYAVARLAYLARELSDGGNIDFMRMWTAQAADGVLVAQIKLIAEIMADVLRSPPLAGQNIGEWAKQQACRKRAFETEVPIAKGFRSRLVTSDETRAAGKAAQQAGRIDQGLAVQKEIMARDAAYWERVRLYARRKNLLFPEDEKALVPAVNVPKMVPTDRQAARLVALVARCEESGFES
jgi:hypothetical protein